eukprot:Lithocolla_globosa_v1_NODE_4390_length_1447_cov_21.141523.p2 type:complete len:115 gc:universal NODE_4390_length_1447_cov_21.141523:659-1003(+)
MFYRVVSLDNVKEHRHNRPRRPAPRNGFKQAEYLLRAPSTSLPTHLFIVTNTHGGFETGEKHQLQELAHRIHHGYRPVTRQERGTFTWFQDQRHHTLPPLWGDSGLRQDSVKKA